MSQSKTNLASLQRHKDYFLPGGDLYFLVEHYHFRVHRYFFERESAYFQAKLLTPANPGAPQQGTSEANAIVLEGVKASEFERLLWVFYNPKYSLYETTIEDWTIILDLSHKWNFPEVKALAVRELQKMELSEVDRIALYHKYEVDKQILVPYYAALCSREQTLTYDEGLKLGIETALSLARARECARSPTAVNGARSPLPPDLKPDDVNALVRDLFGLQKNEANGASPPNTKPKEDSGGGKRQVNGKQGKGDKHNAS